MGFFLGQFNTKSIRLFHLDADDNVASEQVIATKFGWGVGRALDLEFGDDGLYFTTMWCDECGFNWREANSRGASVYRLVRDE